MKNAILIFAIVFGFSTFNTASAQAETKDLNKSLRKELKSKAIRKARKESKDLTKEGYFVAPGALPLDMQLERAWIRQLQTDDNGYPEYIVSTGIAVGESQIAAKTQAVEAAKLELAGTIANNIAAMIENNIANQQLTPEEAASVTKTVAASKNVIAQELGRVIPMVEVYRKVSNSIEVSVRVAYDSKLALSQAKNTIRQQLEGESKALQEKLDKLMEFDTL